MNDTAAGRTLSDYFRVVRRRWIYPATIIPGVLLLAVFLAYVLPATYRSTGVIMIEASTISDRVLPSTVDELKADPKDNTGAYVDQQLDLVRRRVTSVSALKELVATVDPYPEEKDLSPEQKAELIAQNTAIERVDPITLKPAVQSMAFAVEYDNPDPLMAQKIGSRLVHLFVTYNQRTRAEQAAQTYNFLVQQSHEIEVSMRDMEKKLAQFKEKFGDALPDAQVRNLTGIDRVQRDLDSFEEQIRTEEAKEGPLALQLAQTSPSLMAAVSDWRTQLATLRSQLADAEQKYTPEHPDVKRLKRAIADLAAMGAAGNDVSINKPDNPEYLLVQSQLSAVRNNLAALRSRAAKARYDLSHYETQVGLAPGIEEKYTGLTRDYQTATAQYEDVQTKIKAAALAKQLENEARGERFTMIRPADLPTSPEFPNRLGLILIGLVLGGAISLAAAAVVEASDPSVRGTDDLQDIMETTPVGNVPLIHNSQDLRRRRIQFGSMAAAFAVAAAIVGITILSAT